MSNSIYTPEFEARYIKGLILNDRKIDLALRVEGVDDEYFWESCFKEAQPNKNVLILVESMYYPSSGTTGKRVLLELAPFTDGEFIVCVDSDYDYILHNTDIEENPYVLQTYAGCIENVICNPERLNEICCKCAKTNQIDFNFTGFYKRYSEIIYPLFLISMRDERIRNSGDLSDSLFDRRRLGGFVSLNTPLDIDNDCENALQVLQNRVNDRLEELIISEEEIIEYTQLLTDLNILPTDLFWFIRGKNILNGVTIKLLNAIAHPFHTAKRNSIRESTSDGSQIARLIQEYNSEIPITKDILFKEYPINSFPFFPQIQQDIQIIFQQPT